MKFVAAVVLAALVVACGPAYGHDEVADMTGDPSELAIARFEKFEQPLSVHCADLVRSVPVEVLSFAEVSAMCAGAPGAERGAEGCTTSIKNIVRVAVSSDCADSVRVTTHELLHVAYLCQVHDAHPAHDTAAWSGL